MLFRIVGANPQTGRTVDMTLDAPDAQTARQVVSDRGMIVTSVTPAVPGMQMPGSSSVPRPTTPPPARVAASVPESEPRPMRPQPIPQPNGYRPPAEPLEPEEVPQEYAASDEDMVDLGTASSKGPRRPSVMKKLLKRLVLLGVFLLVVGILAGLYFLGMFSGASISAYRKFIPPNATFVGYFDMDKLRASELYKDNEAMFKPAAGAYAPPGIDTAREMFVVGTGDSSGLARAQAVVVYRTRADASLDTGAPANATHMKIEDLDVVKVPGSGAGYVTKLDSKLFCMSENQDALKDAIRRWHGALAAGTIDPEMQRALDRVVGEDSVIVFNGKTAGVAQNMKATAFGFSVGSTITARACALFNTSGDAEVAFKQYDLLKSMSKNKSPAAATDMSKFVDGITISQSNEMINAKGDWKYADVKSLTSQLKPIIGGPPAPRPPLAPPRPILKRP